MSREEGESIKLSDEPSKQDNPGMPKNKPALIPVQTEQPVSSGSCYPGASWLTGTGETNYVFLIYVACIFLAMVIFAFTFAFSDAREVQKAEEAAGTRDSKKDLSHWVNIKSLLIIGILTPLLVFISTRLSYPSSTYANGVSIGIFVFAVVLAIWNYYMLINRVILTTSSATSLYCV
jgi:hypothetical protein